MKYVMSLDQGTTSSRCIIFDNNGKIVSCAQKEFRQIYPKSGWVEHNPDEIYSSQVSVAAEALALMGATAQDIECIGITNQRETTILWDKNTGEPIYNAIVWQCRRTSDYIEKIKADNKSDVITDKTGLVPDPYFSATKIMWILDNVEGAREKAQRGDLLFGTVDCYLIWKLTGGKVHATDCTNASRTMLYNIYKNEWDSELLEYFNIPNTNGTTHWLDEGGKIYDSYYYLDSDGVTVPVPYVYISDRLSFEEYLNSVFTKGRNL